MTSKLLAFTSACAATLGSVGLLAVAGFATNTVITGATAPVMAKSFKEANGWSSGDYFGPRASSTFKQQQLALSCRERNGWSGGDYFGPSC